MTGLVGAEITYGSCALLRDDKMVMLFAEQKVYKVS